MSTLSSRCALITGASSGIGAAFAERLAGDGVDLVLVARSGDRLRALAQRLIAATGRRVEVVVADLAEAGCGARLKADVDALGLDIDLLVNNAGFATTGRFEAQDPAREAEEIRLNVMAVVDLAHAFAPPMLAAGRGAIINIASSAAFQPMPFFSVYAATKAFVYSFSDALREEFRGRGVAVLAVCPGPVDTAFFEATGEHRLRAKVPARTMVSAPFVVDATLRGLAAGDRVVVPGGLMKLSALAGSLVPRGALTRLVGHLMR